MVQLLKNCMKSIVPLWQVQEDYNAQPENQEAAVTIKKTKSYQKNPLQDDHDSDHKKNFQHVKLSSLGNITIEEAKEIAIHKLHTKLFTNVIAVYLVTRCTGEYVLIFLFAITKN